MGSDAVKLNGFEILCQKLKENNIDVKEEELSSLFLQSLENSANKTIDVREFTKIILQTYGLNSSEEIFKTLSEVASLDGNIDDLSIEDFTKIENKALNSENLDSLLNDNVEQVLITLLENIVLEQEKSLNSIKENNGVIANAWDKFKNATGLGAGSDKILKQISELKERIENTKNANEDLASLYKDITGNDLNEDELNALFEGNVDFSNSTFLKDVSKYQTGQKQAVNTISTVTSALAVTGLAASGIFTGGLSWLAAGALCVGAGTAAYMAPQAIDGLTEKDGYDGIEIAQDLASGLVNSTVQTVAMGTAGSVANAITAKTGSQALGKFMSAEAIALELGDGIAVGDYLAQAAVTRLDDLAVDEEDKSAYEQIISGEITQNDENYEEIFEKANRYYSTVSNNSDLSLEGFATVFATSTTASLAAGAAAFGVQSTLGSALSNATLNSSATVQSTSKIMTGGATGGAAGASAAFAGGGTNYIVTSKINGEEIDFDEWLNSSSENIKTALITGFATGTAFEAVQIKAGTQAPSGTKKTNIYKSENGIAKEYLDENGNIIARDISAKDLSKYLKSQETLVEYNWENTNEQLIQNGTRTVRFNFTNGNIEQINYWGNPIQNKPNYSTSTNMDSSKKQTQILSESEYALNNAKNNTQLLTVQDRILSPYAILNQEIINYTALDKTTTIGNDSISIPSKQFAVYGVKENTQLSNDTTVKQESIEDIIMEHLKANGELEGLSERRALKLCKEVSTTVQHISENLKTHKINISENDLIDIIDAGKYWTDLSYALTSLTGMADRKYAGRAYVLAQLKNNGVITDEMLKNVTETYNEQGAFTAAFNANVKGDDYFEEVLKTAGLDNEQISIITDIASSITYRGLSSENLSGIDWTDIGNLDSNTLTLMKRGLNLSSILLNKDNFDFEALLNETDDTYSINIIELQNDSGKQLIAKKTVPSLDNPENAQNGDYIDVTKIITMNPDGSIIKSTTLTDKDNNSEAWYYNSSNTLITNKKLIDEENILVSQIEIIPNEKGEPSYILYTKPSDKLNGAFETTKYTLSDYPEDMDVLSAIKEGTIKGGEVLSSVTSDNGIIQYSENYEQNGNKINRSYNQKVNKDGSLASTSYKYQIVDGNGNELLSLDRSWTKNSDQSTTTTINGKTYTANFDDDTKTIDIIQEGKEKISISIDKLYARRVVGENMFSPFSDEEREYYTRYTNSQEQRNDFWEFCKTLPAEQLINLGTTVKSVKIIKDGLESNMDYEGRLTTGLEASIIFHELGHAKDTPVIEASNTPMTGKTEQISKNEDLIKIYNKEMENFKAQYPELAQEIIYYFSQTGGTAGMFFADPSNTGLSEFVAETNALLTTYGHAYDAYNAKARAEYIVRYFPETVAKIAQLTGYSSADDSKSAVLDYEGKN